MKKKKEEISLEIEYLELNMFLLFFFSYYKLQLVCEKILCEKNLKIEGKLLTYD